MSRLLAAIVATALVFATFVYMLVIVPVMGGFMDVVVGFEAMDGDWMALLERVEMTATRIVPTLLVLGAILFGFIAVSRRQGTRGRL